MLCRLVFSLAFAAYGVSTVNAAEASYTANINGNAPIVDNSNAATVTGVNVRTTARPTENNAATVTDVSVRTTDNSNAATVTGISVRTPTENSAATITAINVRQSNPTPLTDENIHQAVALWLDNPTAAEQMYGGPMKQWDTQYVTNLDHLFAGASTAKPNKSRGNRPTSNFNENLNRWNTAGVTSMEYTFAGCTYFNQPLRGWDTSEVTSLQGMFNGAASFNQDLSKWKTTEVTDLGSTFKGASRFNGNLEGWDTSRVVTMERTFYGATFVDGSSLSGWNTGAVTNMQFTFSGATAFQGDIAQWNTASVETMAGMFAYTALFDQDISGWNMENVQFIDRMFYRAQAFGQELCWESLGPQVSGVELFCGSSGMLCDTQQNWPIGYEDNDDECPEAWQEMEEDELAREGEGLEGQPPAASEVLDLQKYGGSTEGVGRGGSGGIGAMNPASEAMGRDHPENTANLPGDVNDRPNDRAEGFVENVQVIPTPEEESADNGGGFTTDALEEDSAATTKFVKTSAGLLSLVLSAMCLL